jgi:N-dimethylarginine dimethylaminohydrolase
MPTVLLCPPDYFDVVDQKTPYQTRDAALDLVKARRRWDVLGGALQPCGCEVEIVEPVAGSEDMAFAANQVLVGVMDRYAAAGCAGL